MITLTHVHKSFGDNHVLRGVSPPSTGPSSRTMPMATIEGTANSAWNRAPPS